MLAGVAEDLEMTSFLVVADGDQAVTVDSVEPTSLDAHVAYRPAHGTRSTVARPASPCSRDGPPCAANAPRSPRRRRTGGRRAAVK